MASYTAPYKIAKKRARNGKMKDTIKDNRKSLTQDDISAMILVGSIPSAISDMGATSTAVESGHQFRFLNCP